MSAAESLDPALFSGLVDNLYVEAMVMADEARSYFDREAEAAKDRLDVMTRLAFTCESLKVTTRLMHVIAWLLTQKACLRGEMPAEAADAARYRLGAAAETDPEVLRRMPEAACALVAGSQSLYARVMRLQQSRMGAEQTPEAVEATPDGPARDLLRRLESYL